MLLGEGSKSETWLCLPILHPATRLQLTSSSRPRHGCCSSTSSFLWLLQRWVQKKSPQHFCDSTLSPTETQPGDFHPLFPILTSKNTLSSPHRGLLLSRGELCWVCSSPPFPFCLLAPKHQFIMESSRAEDTESQKHLAEATK